MQRDADAVESRFLTDHLALGMAVIQGGARLVRPQGLDHLVDDGWILLRARDPLGADSNRLGASDALVGPVGDLVLSEEFVLG